MARIAILDSHDVIAESHGRLPQYSNPDFFVPPPHHHILFQLEDEDEVLATGLQLGTGTADKLLFSHLTGAQMEDTVYRAKLQRFGQLVLAGIDGLFYLSAHEQLSTTPQGQAYLTPDGTLLR